MISMLLENIIAVCLFLLISSFLWIDITTIKVSTSFYLKNEAKFSKILGNHGFKQSHSKENYNETQPENLVIFSKNNLLLKNQKLTISSNNTSEVVIIKGPDRIILQIYKQFHIEEVSFPRWSGKDDDPSGFEFFYFTTRPRFAIGFVFVVFLNALVIINFSQEFVKKNDFNFTFILFSLLALYVVILIYTSKYKTKNVKFYHLEEV